MNTINAEKPNCHTGDLRMRAGRIHWSKTISNAKAFCMCSAQGDTWGGDAGVGYLNALIVSCDTVKDPLSSISLDLTRQCVNVSLSRDDLKEVCSPLCPGCPRGCPVRTPSTTEFCRVCCDWRLGDNLARPARLVHEAE